MLTPFFLGATVGAVAAGAVPARPAAVRDRLDEPDFALVGALAVGTGRLRRGGLPRGRREAAEMADLVAAFRTRALGAAAVAGVLAIGGLAVVEATRPISSTASPRGSGLAP